MSSKGQRGGHRKEWWRLPPVLLYDTGFWDFIRAGEENVITVKVLDEYDLALVPHGKQSYY